MSKSINSKIQLGLLSVTLTALVLTGAVLLPPSGSEQAQAQAGGTELTGWAWSSNIGWISMNCSNEGTCNNEYRVSVDVDGNLSGWAWANPRDEAAGGGTGSNNIGWLSFNSGDVLNCPGEGLCAPQVDSTGKMTGWARFYSGDPSKDGSDDGWSGWVHLGGGSAAANGYGVTLNNNPNSGATYAWGDDVVGWVDFDGVMYDGLGGEPSISFTGGRDEDGCGPGTVRIRPGGKVDLCWSFTNIDANDCEPKFVPDSEADDDNTGYGWLNVDLANSSETTTRDITANNPVNFKIMCNEGESTEQDSTVRVLVTELNVECNEQNDSWVANVTGSIGDVEYSWLDQNDNVVDSGGSTSNNADVARVEVEDDDMVADADCVSSDDDDDDDPGANVQFEEF